MAKIEADLYEREDVVGFAKELIGCTLHTHFDGIYTSGIITETEAYNGVDDKAAHSYGGKRTKRTEVMFGPGGISYVYLCYGIHHLFNVVIGPPDVPRAILVRAIWPMDGVDHMYTRRGKQLPDHKLGAGPGTSSEALGIKTYHNGIDLRSNEVWLENRIIHPAESDIIVGPRIGVDYAQEDAQLPYRFRLLPKTIKRLLNGALVEDSVHGNTGLRGSFT